MPYPVSSIRGRNTLLDQNYSFNFETGDLSQFDFIHPESVISVTENAGLAGTRFGAAFTYIGSGVEAFVTKEISHNISEKIEVRVYINPNSVEMSNNSFLIIEVENTLSAPSISIGLHENESGEYFISCATNDASMGGIISSPLYSISNAEHWIEAHAERSVDADPHGILKIWIDGNLVNNTANINNRESFATAQLIIVLGTLSKVINGTIYIDEIVVNIAGAWIGPKL